MTMSAFVGVCLTLAFVLGLVAVTMRLLRKVSLASPLSRRAPRMTLEVIQRLPLGPRQGIAVVRIGEQLVAVSVGEGGVRPIVELDVPAQAEVTEPAAAAASERSGEFAPALLARLRAAGLPLAIALALTGTASPSLGQAPSARAHQRPRLPRPHQPRRRERRAPLPAAPTSHARHRWCHRHSRQLGVRSIRPWGALFLHSTSTSPKQARGVACV